MGNVNKICWYYLLYKDEVLEASTKLEIIQEMYWNDVDMYNWLKFLQEDWLIIKEK